MLDGVMWIYPALGLSGSEQGALLKKNEVLKFLGIGMTGVLLVLQALFSYRRAKSMEDTVFFTEQGQRQERLKNAIEIWEASRNLYV